ncbi:MAG: 4Fe-4S binding protein [Candidatus Ranarchaeia archaeon]
MIIDHDICQVCFGCAAICPQQAIRSDYDSVEIDPELCNSCKLCIKACPLGAISE